MSSKDAFTNSAARFTWYPGDITVDVAKGDVPGHSFHGNQWTSGESGGNSKYIGFTNQTVVSADRSFSPGYGANAGIQNDGLTKVKMSDGSTGIIKHGSTPWQAKSEIKGGEIAKIMDAPIRGAVAYGKPYESPNGAEKQDLLQPFIEGKTLGDELGGRALRTSELSGIADGSINKNSLDDAQVEDLARIKFFDSITGNIDRHSSNVMVTTDGRLIGIDQGLCFHPAAPMGSGIAFAQRAGFTNDQVQKMNTGMQGWFKENSDTDTETRWNYFMKDWGESHPITKGDVPGHVFHGNQWQPGESLQSFQTEPVNETVFDNTKPFQQYNQWISQHVTSVYDPNGDRRGADSMTSNNLGATQQKAIDDYTELQYMGVNQYLRGNVDPASHLMGTPEEWRKTATALSSAINKSTVDAPTTVWRSVASGVLENLKAGDTFTDKGFTSTTMIKDVTDRWNGRMQDRALVQIAVPAGTHALAIAATDTPDEFGNGGKSQASEAELILDAGSQFRVNSILTGPDGQSSYDLSYVGDEDDVTKAATPSRFVWYPGDIQLNVSKGDVDGHVFHGNQWTQGESGEFQNADVANTFDTKSHSALFTTQFNSWASSHVTSSYDPGPGDGTHPESRGLSNEQANEVDAYVGRGFARLNASLRSDKPIPDSVQKRKDLISSAINSSHIDVPVTVFRSLDGGVLDDLKPGDTFTDKGFVSTTMTKGIAELFPHSALAVISLPKETPALAITRSAGASEAELLLDSGSQFRLDSTSTNGTGSGRYIYNMTYVGNADTVTKSAPSRFVWYPGDITIDVQKGDDPGHEFHGNQWTGGEGGSAKPELLSFQTRRFTNPSALAWAVDNVPGYVGPQNVARQATPTQVAALRKYGEFGYEAINKYLRGQGGRASKSDITNIQAAINKSELQTSVTVFRGTDGNILKGLKPGDTFTDKGFVSTSLNRFTAKDWGEPGLLNATLNITLPAKSNAFGLMTSEQELLLGAGSQFRVDGISTDSKSPEYSLTYLGSPQDTNVQKGDVPGHDFHGNQYTASDGSTHTAYWHGSPNGVAGLQHGALGIHVGSYQAAKEALEARIGARADGKDWDGTQEYGKTDIGRPSDPDYPQEATYNQPTRQADGSWGKGPSLTYQQMLDVKAQNPNAVFNSHGAVYSDGSPVPMTAKPSLFPVAITGKMSNTPNNPLSDSVANGKMRGLLASGHAKSGYYYTNEGEGVYTDENGGLHYDVSAVVPSADHLQLLDRSVVKSVTGGASRSLRFVWYPGDITINVNKGDTDGHPFHGNQYQSGESGDGSDAALKIVNGEPDDVNTQKAFNEWASKNVPVRYGQTRNSVGLTEEQAYAFSGYVGGGAIIEGVLRGTVDPKAVNVKSALEHASQIQSAIDESELHAPTTVFRGVESTDMFSGLKPGDTFTDKGFVSTSMNKQTATGFQARGSGAFVEIHLPAGTHTVATLNDDSNIDGNSDGDETYAEYELTLGANSSFRVDSIDGHNYSLTYLGSPTNTGIVKSVFQPNFVTFTSVDIDKREPIGGYFKGNQNGGFTYIRFQNGSGGVEKELKDWFGNKTGRKYPAELLATNEYLAARVGEVMNAPIRDCLFTKNGRTIVMPFIIGQSGEELGGQDVPDNPQGNALRLFDYLTANSDRRPKNLVFTPDKRIVGIDHALCNFRVRTPSPELISYLWNSGVSTQSLKVLRPKLMTLEPHFAQLGMNEQHENMMGNLDRLIEAIGSISSVVKSVVQKGDVAGHAFHGNQYEAGESGGGIASGWKESGTTMVEGINHGMPARKAIELTSVNGNTAYVSPGNAASKWTTHTAMLKPILEHFDQEASGKTVDFVSAATQSDSLAYVKVSSPSTIHLNPPGRFTKQTAYYAAHPDRAAKVRGTPGLLQTAFSVGEGMTDGAAYVNASIDHELGHSAFMSSGARVSSIYDALNKSLTEMGKSPLDWGKEMASSARDYQYSLARRHVGTMNFGRGRIPVNELADHIIASDAGDGTLNYNITNALRNLGMTQYGRTSMSEAIAEWHAMYVSPDIETTPVCQRVADIYGWKGVAKGAPDPSRYANTYDTPDGPLVETDIGPINLLDLANDQQDVQKGDTPGHEFHGNQWVDGEEGADTTGGAHLAYHNWSGKTGNTEHITRTEDGTVPLNAIANLQGAAGEVPGGRRASELSRNPEGWHNFVSDIKENGIRSPIFVTVDPGKEPEIAEGNHRRDAAVELGMKNVPVEVKYYGHSERTGGTLMQRSAVEKGDSPGHAFHGNQWTGGEGAEGDLPHQYGATAYNNPQKWAQNITDHLTSGKEISINGRDLPALLTQMAGMDSAAKADLTDLKINDTDLMGKDGLGYDRGDMPQVSREMQPRFLDSIEDKYGISNEKDRVDPTTLSPSQKHIGGQSVGLKYVHFRGKIPSDKPILISKDNYVLDGHHRWAQAVAGTLEDPKQTIPVIRLDTDIHTAIKVGNEWAADNGVDAKEFGKRAIVTKGDLPGHEFHGNQWQSGESDGGSKYVGFDGQTVVKTLTPSQKIGGTQNSGFTKVEMSDGSLGMIKRGATVEEARNEIKGAEIAKILGSPIRGAVAYGDKYSNGLTVRQDLLQPFIEGKTLNDDQETTLEGLVSGSMGSDKNGTLTQSRDYAAIKFFDNITGNPDRNLDNVIITTKGDIVGIDQGMCFGYHTTPQTLAYAQHSGFTNQRVQSMNDKMQDWFRNNVPLQNGNEYSDTQDRWNSFMEKWNAAQPVQKGDVAGHLFHGNQWVAGVSAAKSLAAMLHARATTHAPDIAKEIDETAQQFGGTRVRSDSMVKTPVSIERKLSKDAKDCADCGTPTEALAHAATELNDVVRFTIQFPGDKFTGGVQGSLDDLRQEGYETVKMKNFFNNDPMNAYRGINAVFKDPIKNQNFEVQFHTPESLAVAERAHLLYDKVREMDEDSPEYAAEQVELREMWKPVPIPPGVESIGTTAIKKTVDWYYYVLEGNDGTPFAFYRYDGTHADAFVQGAWQPSEGFLQHYFMGDPMLEPTDLTTIEGWNATPAEVKKAVARVLEKGDTPGHPFHGNQWQVGESGSEVPDSVKYDKQASADNEALNKIGWHITNVDHGYHQDQYRLSSDGGNTAVIFKQEAQDDRYAKKPEQDWTMQNPATGALLQHIDAVTTGKHVVLGAVFPRETSSTVLGWVHSPDPSTINLVGYRTISGAFGASVAQGHSPAQIVSSVESATDLVSPQDRAIGVFDHELGHSDFYSGHHSIEEIYPALNHQLESMGRDPVDWDSVERESANQYQQNLIGKRVSYLDIGDGESVAVGGAADYMLSTHSGSIPLGRADVKNALTTLGLTSYGRSSLQEAVGEASAIYHNPSLPQPPVVQGIADALGWSNTQKSITKATTPPAPTIYHTTAGPMIETDQGLVPLSLDDAIQKGDLPGHEFHGNQHTGGLGGTSMEPHLAYIQSKASQFFNAGGTINHYAWDSKNLKEVAPEMSAMKAVTDKIAAGPEGKNVRAVGSKDPTHRVAPGNATWRRLMEMQGAYELAKAKGDDLMVARNKDGQIVASANYRPDKGSVNYPGMYKVGVIGASAESPGAGTAIYYEIAKLAAANNSGVKDETEFNSGPYHISIGRSFKDYRGTPKDSPSNGDTSYWTPDETKQIAAISMDAPAVVEKAVPSRFVWYPGDIVVNVNKGDVPGHSFHGNQYTQGQGGGENSAPLLRFQTGAPSLASQPFNEFLSSHVSSVYDPSALAQSHGVTETQWKALDGYTHSEYMVLNESLRYYNVSDNPYLESQAKELSSAVNESKINAPLTTFRGVDARVFSGLKPGDTFTDKGFVSTTMVEGIAADRFGDGTTAKISLPAGTHALGVKMGTGSGEAELILDSGSQFRLDSSSVFGQGSGARTIYNMTYVGDADSPVAKGDTPGHDFHGNQYQTGESGAPRESDPGRFQAGDRFGSATSSLLPFQDTSGTENYPTEDQHSAYNQWVSQHVSAVYDPRDWSDAPPAKSLTTNVTKEQGASVVDYQAIGSKNVNGYLRGVTQDDGNDRKWVVDVGVAKRLAKNLGSAVHAGTLDSPLTVFRTVQDGVFDNAKPGDTFTDKGFFSTTAYSGMAARWEMPVEAQIHLPAGTHALAITDTPNGQREGELLLDSGSMFHIDGVSEANGIKTVNMTYTGDADDTPVEKSAALSSNSDRFTWSPGDIVMNVAKGDTPGHEFHGNQWTSGEGGGASDSKYVGLTNQTVVSSIERIDSNVGAQNSGLTKVLLSDGSTGMIKHGATEDQALSEIKGAEVAQIMGVPIRGAVAYGKPYEEQDSNRTKQNLLQPFVKGQTLRNATAGTEEYITATSLRDIALGWSKPDLANLTDDQARDLAAVKFFDTITGNTDRHPSNVMITSDGKLIGIDQGLCFTNFDNSSATESYILAQRAGFTDEQVQKMNIGMKSWIKANPATANMEAFGPHPSRVKSTWSAFMKTWNKQPTVKSAIIKGDVPGHEFHGNQYEPGESGSPSRYLGVGTTEIVKNLGNKITYGGAQNYGFQKVRLADGSTGIIKRGVGLGLADNEVLGSKIAQALGSPIRGAVILPGSEDEYDHVDLLQTYIKGKTFDRFYPSDAADNALFVNHPQGYHVQGIQDSALHDLMGIKFFDELTGNPDRHESNVMVTDEGEHMIGIDQGLCFTQGRASYFDLLSAAQRAGITSDDVKGMNERMQGLLSDSTMTSQQQDDLLNNVMPSWNNFVSKYPNAESAPFS